MHSKQDYFTHNCGVYSALEINWRSSWCKNAVFMRPIEVDLYAFETALVNAAIHVGVDLKLRGVAPVRDDTTITGWK